MRGVILAAVAALSLAACSGPGGQTAAPFTPAGPAGPTPAPIVQPTSVPVNTPSPTPTTAPVGNHIAGAPAVIVGSSAVRAPLQALGSGGVPTIVIGQSATMGIDFSNVFVWVANAQNQAVPEAVAPTVVPSGPMTIGHVVLDNVNLFASTVFDYIIEPSAVTGAGKISLTIAYPDGVSGILNYYSYNRFNLQCNGVSTPSNPQTIGYVSGVLVGQGANTDVQANCLNNSVTFTNGAVLLANPAPDAYGNVAPQFTTVLSPTATFAPLTISTVTVGAIYLVKLTDGGCSKVMWTQSNNPPGQALLSSGIALRGSGSTCNFSF